MEPARAISGRVDLAGVGKGALDEIFQAEKPVLVGVDTATTYCFLLSLEEHRDADTWGVHLLELVDQGFNPKPPSPTPALVSALVKRRPFPMSPAKAMCSTSSPI